MPNFGPVCSTEKYKFYMLMLNVIVSQIMSED